MYRNRDGMQRRSIDLPPVTADLNSRGFLNPVNSAHSVTGGADKFAFVLHAMSKR
jgi:hypothetical protein